ncbi:MAG: macro domain-containing protein [Myxococcota bacterium]
MRIHQTEITVVRGSVLDQDVDAVVNAANTAMRGGGGIDGATHRAAGPELMRELQRVAPHGAKTGTVVVTGGHRLKQRHVFRTPGPVWNGGRSQERALLASCYRTCMDQAQRLQLSSLGFCSISTGVYGFPLDLAAPIALSTVAEWLRGRPETSLRRLVFAMFGAQEFDVFSAALRELEAG